MDIDLGPTSYRVKGRKTQRYLSMRLFKWLATLSGIWAGGIYYTFQHWLVLNPSWALLPLALAPGAVLFVTWLLLGGEDSVDPPEMPRDQRRR